MTKSEFKTFADRLGVLALDMLIATENQYGLDDILKLVKLAKVFQIQANEKNDNPERTY